MTITNYICDLLYRYECVIVPEFGAFLTSRIPARLSSDNHIFYPPQKQISFNQQIITNDGLLANYIASSEHISYEKSVEKIQLFVQQVRNELAEKSRFSLSEIGFFNVNFEQKLVFEPIHTTNYLPEAFGLSTFTPHRVIRETLKEEVAVLEEKSPILFTPERRKKYTGFKYAAAVLAVFGLGAILLNSYKTNLQEFNDNEIVAGGHLFEEQIQSASFVLDIPNPLPSISVAISNPEIETIAANYHIVAGAFREFENVDKKIAQLKRKGFDATYIGANKYGLHQVVYSSHTTKREAINTLQYIKNTHNRSAWLLVTK